MKNYQTPNCTVITFDNIKDVIRTSGGGSEPAFAIKTDTVDTYTDWNDLFGGGE